MLRSEVITDTRRLEALRVPWKDLLARSTNDEPMASPAWLLSWWKVFGPLDGRALRTVAFFDGAKLVGLAPLLVRDRRAFGLRVKRVELLGTGEDERDEVGSDYVSLIAERGAERSVAVAFADALDQRRLGSFDELTLGPMKADSPVTMFLADALSTRGFMVGVQVVGASFHVPLPKTWDAYLALLTPSRRAMVRRSIRAFERWAGGDVHFDVATNPAEVAQMKDELVRLHGTRWAQAGRDGAFSSSLFSAFHDDAIPALFEEGALELACLRARGRTVAALYNVVWRDRVQFYQCGRAVDLPSELRPGIVIHARALARAIERGLREYDFLPSLARYKAELSLASRPIVSLRAARPTMFELVQRTASLAVDHLRALRAGRRAQSASAEEPAAASAKQAERGEPALELASSRVAVDGDAAKREAVDRPAETLEAR